MKFSEAEAEIRAWVEAQWALGDYTSFPLVWENEDDTGVDEFVYIKIEGTFSDKTIFGSVGKRISVEAGIVFVHCFVEKKSGKARAMRPIEAMVDILQLKVLASVIDLDGASPPSPVDDDEASAPSGTASGNYYRCSASVPFIIRSSV